MYNENPASEIRCAACQKLLAKGQALRLSIKCPRCRALNIFESPGASTSAAQTATKVNKK